MPWVINKDVKFDVFMVTHVIVERGCIYWCFFVVCLFTISSCKKRG